MSGERVLEVNMTDEQKVKLFVQTIEEIKILDRNFEMGFYTPDEAMYHLINIVQGLVLSTIQALDNPQE